MSLYGEDGNAELTKRTLMLTPLANHTCLIFCFYSVAGRIVGCKFLVAHVVTGA